MDFQGVSALIVALTGAAAVVVGGLATRRGKAEERRQTEAADQALGDKSRLQETQQALDTLAALNDRLTATQVARDARIDVLEGELDEANARRRRELADQEALCRTTVAELHDIVTTLRNVVVDEIARAAAGARVDMVRPHPHDPLPDLD